MEKIKEFISSPKKTATLGLICGILVLLFEFIRLQHTFERIYITLGLIFAEDTIILGLIVYFTIILLRLKGKNINIKIANYTLLVTSIIQVINSILNFISIVHLITTIATTIFFVEIFFKKKLYINNIVFSILILLQQIVNLVLSMRNANMSSYIIMTIIGCISYLLIIPYFFNYYEILKEENKNGK